MFRKFNFLKIFNKNPEKHLKINEDSKYKEIIEKCMNLKLRPTFEQIQQYIDENEFEEIDKEKRIDNKEEQEKEKIKKENIDFRDE